MEKIEIVYEDNFMLAVDKPANFIVNRADTHSLETMQDFTEDYLGLDSDEEGTEYFQRSGIVHRLDKDTSGVLLIAKDKDTFEKLQSQFKERLVKKEYRAIALGHFEQNKTLIDAPLGRNPKNRMTMGVIAAGKEAITEIRLLRNFTIEKLPYAYLKILPNTGRTHQIRVHLTAVSHPIAADPIYCSKRQFALTSTIFPRMMLHSLSLEVAHPQTGKKILLESRLPQDFEKYI